MGRGPKSLTRVRVARLQHKFTQDKVKKKKRPKIWEKVTKVLSNLSKYKVMWNFWYLKTKMFPLNSIITN